jgi:hypothetical protein
MGCYDIFCIICGLPCHNTLNNIDLKKYKSITKWMNNATILTASNETIEKCIEVDCNNTFQAKNKILYSGFTNTGFMNINYW